ncbi:GIY-YIG nuclease family protein [Mesorhizobium sp. B4-1-4]|nr:GIY-YIG nuclease family protein [Mesorhizobium sp. B4-1-4]UCI33335.1 GIY-YIG nuclease family protein [Mesorhizobium sp. B4-1-4]
MTSAEECKTSRLSPGRLAAIPSLITGYVYMTASRKRGTIYIGVTNDLGRRMPEHKSGEGSRFTGRYGVQRLVWYEEYFDIRDAIQREKSLKRWPPMKDRTDRKGQFRVVRAFP